MCLYEKRVSKCGTLIMTFLQDITRKKVFFEKNHMAKMRPLSEN